MRKHWSGYLSLEAALVMPFTIILIFFLLGCLFYVYNRALQEQDVGLLALEGAVYDGTKEETMQYLKNRADEIYRDKYVALSFGEISICLEKDSVTVMENAEMPLWGSAIFLGENQFSIQAKYTNKKIDPVLFTRLVRRLRKKKTQ